MACTSTTCGSGADGNDHTSQGGRLWGEYGPAMRALNSRQRAFVEFLLIEPPTRGA